MWPFFDIIKIVHPLFPRVRRDTFLWLLLRYGPIVFGQTPHSMHHYESG